MLELGKVSLQMRKCTERLRETVKGMKVQAFNNYYQMNDLCIPQSLQTRCARARTGILEVSQSSQEQPDMQRIQR